jgi:ATP-dependent helicase/DNAse subunit B
LSEALLAGAWHEVKGQLQLDLDAADALEPQWMEHSFGMPDSMAPALVLEHPFREARIRVRGSIDRVDYGDGSLRVMDYKRTLHSRAEQRHFQLPMYLAAVLQEVQCGGAPWDVQRVQAVWSGLHDPKRRMAEDLATDPEVFSSDLASIMWARIDDLAVGGVVTPDPQPIETCRSCDYRSLCRYRVDSDPTALEEIA